MLLTVTDKPQVATSRDAHGPRTRRATGRSRRRFTAWRTCAARRSGTNHPARGRAGVDSCGFNEMPMSVGRSRKQVLPCW